MPRVLIVDDHAFIRRGVQSILQIFPEWDVCGEAGDGADAVRLADELSPDVILMDVTMPGMNGIEAARCIGQRAEIVFVGTTAPQHSAARCPRSLPSRRR